MSEHLFDSYHRAAESWMQTQQELLRNLIQGTFWPRPAGAAGEPEAMQAARRRWLELTVEILNRQRESTEAFYRSVIHLIEQSSRISEAKSAEEIRRAGEDLWNEWMEGLRSQSESRLREAQRFAEKSLEIAHGAQA